MLFKNTLRRGYVTSSADRDKIEMDIDDDIHIRRTNGQRRMDGERERPFARGNGRGEIRCSVCRSVSPSIIG